MVAEPSATNRSQECDARVFQISEAGTVLHGISPSSTVVPRLVISKEIRSLLQRFDEHEPNRGRAKDNHWNPKLFRFHQPVYAPSAAKSSPG
jgi:hypothetical protein